MRIGLRIVHALGDAASHSRTQHANGSSLGGRRRLFACAFFNGSGSGSTVEDHLHSTLEANAIQVRLELHQTLGQRVLIKASIREYERAWIREYIFLARI